jgi:hypothetical protein
VLRHADEGNYDAYLEASPNSVSLYQTFGFKEMGRVEVVVRHEPYYNLCMVRETGSDVASKNADA